MSRTKATAETANGQSMSIYLNSEPTETRETLFHDRSIQPCGSNLVLRDLASDLHNLTRVSLHRTQGIGGVGLLPLFGMEAGK